MSPFAPRKGARPRSEGRQRAGLYGKPERRSISNWRVSLLGFPRIRAARPGTRWTMVAGRDTIALSSAANRAARADFGGGPPRIWFLAVSFSSSSARIGAIRCCCEGTQCGTLFRAVHSGGRGVTCTAFPDRGPPILASGLVVVVRNSIRTARFVRADFALHAFTTFQHRPAPTAGGATRSIVRPTKGTPCGNNHGLPGNRCARQDGWNPSRTAGVS